MTVAIKKAEQARDSHISAFIMFVFSINTCFMECIVS